MANIDNECKDLEVKDLYSDSSTHLHDMMTHQKYMQEYTYNLDFSEMTIAEIKDGSGSAVWKYWKKDHKKYENMKISDLSEGDKKELYMEWVDVFHFFMNYAASIGLDAKTAYNYYYAKAEENKKRQHRGY
jgi:hypothetical protein